MNLIDDARRVLTQAWSVRFAAASSVLTIAGMLTESLPYLQGFIPDSAIKVLAAACGIAAVIARVIKQPKMRSEP